MNCGLYWIYQGTTLVRPVNCICVNCGKHFLSDVQVDHQEYHPSFGNFEDEEYELLDKWRHYLIECPRCDAIMAHNRDLNLKEILVFPRPQKVKEKTIYRIRKFFYFLFNKEKSNG